jgi:hypothetical protein
MKKNYTIKYCAISNRFTVNVNGFFAVIPIDADDALEEGICELSALSSATQQKFKEWKSMLEEFKAMWLKHAADDAADDANSLKAALIAATDTQRILSANLHDAADYINSLEVALKKIQRIPEDMWPAEGLRNVKIIATATLKLR